MEKGESSEVAMTNVDTDKQQADSDTSISSDMNNEDDIILEEGELAEESPVYDITPVVKTPTKDKCMEIGHDNVHEKSEIEHDKISPDIVSVDCKVEDSDTCGRNKEIKDGQLINTVLPLPETKATDLPSPETKATDLPSPETKVTDLPSPETKATDLPSPKTKTTPPEITDDHSEKNTTEAQDERNPLPKEIKCQSLSLSTDICKHPDTKVENEEKIPNLNVIKHVDNNDEVGLSCKEEKEEKVEESSSANNKTERDDSDDVGLSCNKLPCNEEKEAKITFTGSRKRRVNNDVVARPCKEENEEAAPSVNRIKQQHDSDEAGLSCKEEKEDLPSLGSRSLRNDKYRARRYFKGENDEKNPFVDGIEDQKPQCGKSNRANHKTADEVKLPCNDVIEIEDDPDDTDNNDDHNISSSSLGESSKNETDGGDSLDVSFVSSCDEDEVEPLPYEQILENDYLVNKKKTRASKEVRRMKCECVFDSEDSNFIGCGDDCLNRLLMIECGNKCACGEFCTNRNFQSGCRKNIKVIKTAKKGRGLQSGEDIEKGDFIIEYCGEVVDYDEFTRRTEIYDSEGRKHYYFMTLRGNEIIDATKRGGISRFINHSCDPNCETQKWTVNGFLRVGFFALKHVQTGEELSFDYKFERYGDKAQKCYCGAKECRGIIGGTKQTPLKSYEKHGSSNDSPKRKEKKKTQSLFSDTSIEEDINRLLGIQNKIKTRDQALELTRVMVKLELSNDRKSLLKILQNSTDFAALKAFLRYKGLSLLWSWMVDTPDKKKRFRLEILNTLKIMPIPNRNILIDSKVLYVVEKWSAYSEAELTADEEGSSNSDNDGKEDENDKENKENNDDSQTESEGNNDDAIANLSAELLDRWKLLREVFRIPKKPQTPLKRFVGTSDSEVSSSPGEEKRHGKRKIQSNAAERPSKLLFSPKSQSTFTSTKRLPFESPKRSFEPPKPVPLEPPKPVPHVSPKPLMAELPKPLLKIPLTAATNNSSHWSPAEPSPNKPVESQESDWTESSDGYTDIEDSQEPSSVETVNTEEHWDWGNSFGGKEGFRGRGTFGRGMNRPWRNRQGRSDAHGDGRGRGWRGRGRGRGNFNNTDYEHDNENEGGFNDCRNENQTGNQNFNYAGYNQPNTRNTPYNYQNVNQTRGQFRGRGRGRGQSFSYGDPSKVLTGGNAVAINQPWQGQQAQRVPPAQTQRVPPASENYSQFHQGFPGQDAPHDSPSQPFSNGPPPPPNNMPQNQYGNMRFPHPHPPQPRPPQQYNMRGQMNYSNQHSSPQQYQQNIPSSQNTVSPQWSGPQHNQQQHNQQQHNQQQHNQQQHNQPQHNQPQHNQQQHNQQQHQQQQTHHQQQQQQQQHHQQHEQHHHQQQQHQYRPQLPSVPIQNPYGTPESYGQTHAHNMSLSPQQPMTPTNTSHVQAPNATNTLSQLNIMQHLQDLVNQSKAKAQSVQQINDALDLERTPEYATPHVDPVTPVRDSLRDYKVADVTSPVLSKPLPALPPNWKTATDPEGKIYYYHMISRKTQWERPPWEGETKLPRRKSSESSSGKHDLQTVQSQKEVDYRRQSIEHELAGPRTPRSSPPHSPISPFNIHCTTTAAADTTVTRLQSTRHGPITPPQTEITNIPAYDCLSAKRQRIRDSFKTKLSGVVINCLNPYQKVDCKQARITSVDDFKFLARKLTHGLMMKELTRVKTDEELECKDSVKIKVKEYIKNYMRKYGATFVRT